MKTIVIYNSQTGFTKRYAEWIAQESGADCFELSTAKKKNLDEYDAIIYGGWACAGSISKIGWFKGNINKYRFTFLKFFNSSNGKFFNCSAIPIFVFFENFLFVLCSFPPKNYFLL